MITRFAPSPTGPLHLGHAYSAMLAHDMARMAGGSFLLRMDDIDTTRSKPEYEAQIIDDLQWLGLSWPTPVYRQSQSAPDVAQALAKLNRAGLTYPCRCRRSDIAAAANAPQEGVPTHGPDGQIYPGTCRHRPMSDKQPDDAIRLNMAKATTGKVIKYTDTGPGHAGNIELPPNHLITTIGDPVISRRAGGIAYHLAVVIDDARQNITHVIRGEDLRDATPIHVLLFQLLGLSPRLYHHHRLIRDDQGKRLAKRDDARAIAKYRADGATPQDIRSLVGLPLHLAK